MKKILLSIIIILFIYSCFVKSGPKRTWNHFWCLTEESTEQQSQVLQPQEYESLAALPKDSLDIIDKDGRVVNKVQRKPLVTDGDIPYELVFR